MIYGDYPGVWSSNEETAEMGVRVLREIIATAGNLLIILKFDIQVVYSV